MSIDELTLEYFIEKLKKHERSLQECQVMMKFFEKTEISEKFKRDRMNEILLNQILYFFTLFGGYEFIEQGKFLFRQGDNGNKFFIILKGSMKVLRHKEQIIRVNAEDYFNILLRYSKSGDKDLLDKTIKANKEIFPVLESDTNRLEEIFFRLK